MGGGAGAAGEVECACSAVPGVSGFFADDRDVLRIDGV